MSEDLILKTLTGLMLEQKGMTAAQQTLSRSYREQGKTVNSLQKAVQSLHDNVRRNTKTIEGLAQASGRQEQRFADLLKVMTDFSTTSTDTRKRLLALEQEVEKLS